MVETFSQHSGLADATGEDLEIPPSSSSPHADTGLHTVVGRHVRAFRKARGETLRSLATRSGLSAGFISQLERGQTSISLTALRGLAESLGYPVASFLDERIAHDEAAFPLLALDGADGSAHRHQYDPSRTDSSAVTPMNSYHVAHVGAEASSEYFTLVRAGAAPSSHYKNGKRQYSMLSQRAANLVLEPMIVEIAPGDDNNKAEAHDGEEFAYVISGCLTFVVAGEEFELHPGDSLHLKSSIPHQLYNHGSEPVVVVSVVTPRLF